MERMRRKNINQLGNFSYQANPGLRLDSQVPVDPFLPRHVVESHGKSGDYWRAQAKQTQSEREYYETIIGSHLRRNADRRLRSSTNRHHLVTDNFKPGHKFDDESSDNFDDEYRLKQEQFGNCDRLYARSGDHYRPRYGKAGALRYW